MCNKYISQRAVFCMAHARFVYIARACVRASRYLCYHFGQMQIILLIWYSAAYSQIYLRL